MNDTTMKILEQEKALQETKQKRITDLLKLRVQGEKDHQASKQAISEELRSLGYHTPRTRKSKVQTGAAK